MLIVEKRTLILRVWDIVGRENKGQVPQQDLILVNYGSKNPIKVEKIYKKRFQAP